MSGYDFVVFELLFVVAAHSTWVGFHTEESRFV